ncbi:chorismate mutase [Streptomyces sp. A012304]|uniref:chorismate mutase n=1 Tax=Streptomyces sp. A012304 TaxID=375446 RepID=UPI002230F527|nr:chorismate mutase [Streptomyces sp. A012304]GKQ36846.1 chorismate mutase [Streptomyces sp. A012304]
MRLTTPLRHTLVAAAATAALLTAPGTATAAPRPAGISASALHPVAALSAERLATADLVAAAKWGTDSPIDDPAREQQVLDTVAALAEQAGADPDEVREVFRDQIEANKIVQRGLFRRWTAHPDQAPTSRPDLAVVRQTINRINTDLVTALAATAPERTTPVCRPELALAVLQVHHERHPDALHTRALVRSLASVCR